MQARATPPWRVATVGLLLWTGAGAVLAAGLSLFLHASNAFAVSGMALTIAGIGWALGPFKTPMAWSEGALMAYQGNADGAGDLRPSRWRPMAIPACAFSAGVLLLIVAGVLAAQ